jgi:XRE family transcriptional regulator, regulator of sulfur utilization
MEEMSLLVAQNLKRIREERNLSLDKLAELTGVSKSMLGQVERGESSPTISTVWKISNGLKVSFTTLLNSPQSDTTLIYKENINPLVEDNGKYRLYPILSLEEGRPFEIYVIEIDAGGFLSAEAHPAGTQEFLTVFSGQLSVRVNDEEFLITGGNSIRFHADRPHSYLNPCEEMARINLVISYS